MHTRIKICGITRPEDARQAASCGADAIGLVFYPASPRTVTLEQAERIIEGVPPFVSVVGLFVNAARNEIETVLKRLPLDLLQFHGDESPQDCTGYGRPYLKALRMRDGIDLHGEAQRFAQARGLLLDSYVAGVPGGTGRRFDWSAIPRDITRPLILAGGLDPGNVAEAIATARPYAVDVSGGVEAAPGIKDPDKIAAFIREVRRVDTL
ncbi:MAG: N-(5'-phosphoribosyl)anthranilate isomerase [Gammaproteobacteria bacterium RBG_16_57_12]|nr:MAG: N-(5'-phosphoribosyl)anthranilate isomerase [Gammaproteobacteria bacterium RBG_16_57_12]